MWLNEDEQMILRFLQHCGDVGASLREICRKSSTKDRWKENERWAYPILSGLKEKKLVLTTSSGAFCLPPSEKELEAERKRKEGR
jgi:hypothetical protein